MAWWFKDSPVPLPLVTTGTPIPSVAGGALPGILGQPGTQVLLGDHPLDTGTHLGGRLSAGCYFDPDCPFGVEAAYFGTSSHGNQQGMFTSGLPGSLNLAVPYFDVTGAAVNLHGVPGESIYVLPGPLVSATGAVVPGFFGLVTLNVSTRLQGAELNGLWNLLANPPDASTANYRLEALAGFRWLDVNETLDFDVQTLGQSSSPIKGVPASFFNTTDQFLSHNDFFGGRTGLRGESFWGPLSFRATTALSLGVMNESVAVSGTTQTSGGNLSYATKGTSKTTLLGGIFAQPSNIGSHTRARFAAVPEGNFNVGYYLFGRVRVSVGYNVLFLSTIARPGDQMNPAINSTLTGLAEASRASGGTTPASGPAQPAFNFSGSSFWAQGITVGLELRY